jgi:DNA-binding response OmpR family regulator
MMEKKILIIDDDPNIVDYLDTLFNDQNYKTFSAGNAQDGLALAKKEKPDLITLDLEMPGEWGPRFFRKMSQDPELKNTPVIVISGLTGVKYAVTKAVASISKPFDRNELLNIVKNTLNT